MNNINISHLANLISSISLKDNKDIDWVDFSKAFNAIIPFDAISVFFNQNNKIVHVFSSHEERVELFKDLSIVDNTITMATEQFIAIEKLKKPIVINGQSFYSFLSMPIKVDNSIIATINISSIKEYPYTDMNTDTFDSFCTILSSFFTSIERKKNDKSIDSYRSNVVSIEEDINVLNEKYKKIHDLIDFLTLAVNTLDRKKIISTMTSINSSSKAFKENLNHVKSSLH